VEHAREATAEDLTSLARLWEMAVAELDGERGGPLLAGTLVRSDLTGSLLASMEDPDRLVVVGFIDDVAVGLGSVVVDRRRRELVGELELIYVEPRARQIGVAEEMLQEVLRWCEERGCVGVDAPALPGNRSAKAFFEGQGFTARLLIMHRGRKGHTKAHRGVEPDG
jgi:GNAT superfamily N-acetyltransferase